MAKANETKTDNARNMLAHAVDGSFDAGTRSSNAIARIAVGVVQMMAQGNDNAVTLVTGEGKAAQDVTVSPDILRRYVNKTLAKKGSEATADNPTAGMLIGALADTSERVKATERKIAEHRAKAKDKGTTPLAMVQHEADAERLSQALNTAKQPIRRALTMAAYIATATRTVPVDQDAPDGETMQVPVYDPARTTERDGVVYVTEHGAEDGEAMPITYSLARDKMKPETAEKAPNRASVETGVSADANGSALGVTITPEAVRKGGDARGKLADALQVLSGILSDMDTAPIGQERAALARLYVTCERLLDDDAMQIVADLRDEGDAA